jgi:hypothetical protein
MQKAVVVFVVIVLASSCGRPSRSGYPMVFTVGIENPLNVSRKDAPVLIPSSEIFEMHPEFNQTAFFVMDREAETASQFVEGQGIFLVIDSMTAKESRTLVIYYNKDGDAPKSYKKRTQAELSHKVGGEWKNREYIGGQFRNVDYIRVPPEHKDHSWFLRYEGPGWESDKVGYRFYLDQRNASDVFGKKTTDMVLMGVGQDGFDSYHNIQPWGMDVMKVGKSLGIGSIGRWVDTTAMRVEKTDSVTCRINENGNLYSEITTRYLGWKTPIDTIDLRWEVSIHAGTRWTRNSATTDRVGGTICTGIVKDEKAKLFKGEGSDSSYAYLATYGKQSLNNDNLGLALIFDPESFAGYKEDAFSNIVLLEGNGSFEYYFAAAWELEPNGITNEADFIKYVERSARELANPVVVTLKEPR